MLDWWIGSDFAEDGWAPLAILGVGFGVLACGSIGNVLLDAAGRPGVAAALMIAGGVTGLVLCGSLAAIWDSPFAGSVGASVGLIVIGLGGIELARRLTVPVRRSSSFAGVFAGWIPLAAAGLALRGGCELAGIPAVITALVIAIGTGAVALVLYRPLIGVAGKDPALTPAA